MLAVHVDSLDPAFNLAFEEYLCSTLTPDHPGWLLLWRNGPSVIVGRFQNTVAEVNAGFVEAHRIAVVRRMTGGGAVYHDEGNLNFSFIVPAHPAPSVALPFADTSFGGFLAPLVAALGDLGIEAALSGRNDVLAHGAKCSGSAQQRTRSMILHHGTLMVDLDLSMLGQALAGDPEKYRSKGLASVRSRVTNLKPLLPAGTTMKDIMAAIVRRCGCARLLGRGDLPEAVQAAERLAQQKYRTWDWNYGHSPAFDEVRGHRFPWGKLEIHLRTEHGRITDCRFFGDFFAARDVRAIAARLIGQENRPSCLLAALRDAPLEETFIGCDARGLAAFLAGVDAGGA